MFAILHLLATFAGNLFKSRRQLEVENLFLRHQLTIALRRARRLRLRGSDRKKKPKAEKNKKKSAPAASPFTLVTGRDASGKKFS